MNLRSTPIFRSRFLPGPMRTRNSNPGAALIASLPVLPAEAPRWAGWLAGSNIGDGDPDNADLETPMGTGIEDDEDDAGPPYAGHAGGAVGGTPAQGRAVGGDADHRMAPGGSRRGDSTIGGDPRVPTNQ